MRGVIGALFMALLLWLPAIITPHGAGAQSPAITWSEPMLLSDFNAQSWAPVVTSDGAGNVHAFWSQTMTTNPPSGEGDTLFYSRWDGTSWLEPADIIVSPEGATEWPDVAVTSDGMLHLVWGTGGTNSRLMYSSAPACCAENPHNWAEPVSLDAAIIMQPAIIADDEDRLHVAYASLDSGTARYQRSEDGGQSWSRPVDIYGNVNLEEEVAAYPRLAADGRGRIHLVWTIMPYPGRAILYARSEDNGLTWDDPVEIDTARRADYASASYGPIWVNVATRGADEIHIMWDGAPTVERNHIWSPDGGETWSEIHVLFREVAGVGRSGWNPMVVDSAGTIHAFSLASGRDGPLYAAWHAQGWSATRTIGHTYYSEFLSAAVSHGNRLHVVWVDKTPGQPNTIWYAVGETNAPLVDPRPLPTAWSTPETEPMLIASTPDTPQAPTPAPTAVEYTFDRDSPADGVDPLVAAIVPTLALVGGIVLIRARRNL